MGIPFHRYSDVQSSFCTPFSLDSVIDCTADVTLGDDLIQPVAFRCVERALVLGVKDLILCPQPYPAGSCSFCETTMNGSETQQMSAEWEQHPGQSSTLHVTLLIPVN